MDTLGRLHPLHAPQLCLDIASGKTAVATCSTASTQAFAGLGEYCGDAALAGATPCCNHVIWFWQ